MDDAALEPLERSIGPAVGRLLEKVKPDGRAARAMTKATRDAAATARREARAAAAFSASRIREFPLASAVVALGAGLLLGALLSSRRRLG